MGNLRSTPLHRKNAEIGVTLDCLFQNVKAVFYNILVLVKLEFQSLFFYDDDCI